MSDYQIGDVIAGVPFGIGVAKITAICSGDDPHPDDCGDAHEPLACVGEHSPASWEPSWHGPTDAASHDESDITKRIDTEVRLCVRSGAPIGRLLQDAGLEILRARSELAEVRAELDFARSEVGGLRLRIAAMELTYRAALADAKPVRVVSPLHRALTVRPGAFGLRVGMEG